MSETIYKPCFLKSKIEVGKRNLQEEEVDDEQDILDISNDLLDCKYIINSDVSLSNLQHHFELISWEDDKISFQIIFKNPLLISNGIQKDQLKCKFQLAEIIVSNTTEVMILKEENEMQYGLPKQHLSEQFNNNVNSASEMVKQSFNWIFLI